MSILIGLALDVANILGGFLLAAPLLVQLPSVYGNRRAVNDRCTRCGGLGR